MTPFARAAVLSLLAGCLPWAGHAAEGGGAPEDQSPTLVVFFPDWSGALDSAAKDVIEHAARRAKRIPNVHIEVNGYADDTGSNDANVALTKLRAQRVADQLEEDGIAASAITMKAEGAQRVKGVASRRAEITITAP